mmetsp:Transcript_7775/g.11337  ORF Transcript_7775/g.11337 Transcript_7775/m.11337 type:complete len:213 (-) Transcript_7775:19-657(-)
MIFRSSLTFLLSCFVVTNAFSLQHFGIHLAKHLPPSSREVTNLKGNTERRWCPPELKQDEDDGLEYRGEADGVWTTRSFASGEVVIPGIVIADLGDQNHSHASQVATNWWVQHGGMQSFVNHACYPESNVYPKERFDENEVLCHDLVAIRDIPAKSSVTMDYCMRNLVIEHFPPKCLCGGVECRGTIRGYSFLSAEKKIELRPWTVPYIKEL